MLVVGSCLRRIGGVGRGKVRKGAGFRGGVVAGRLGVIVRDKVSRLPTHCGDDVSVLLPAAAPAVQVWRGWGQLRSASYGFYRGTVTVAALATMKEVVLARCIQ